MSEPVKITSVEKTKDPRRVEAGKKLGAISRQAKERKASEARQTQKQVEEAKEGSYIGVDKSEFSTLAAVFAAAAVIGVIAIQYRSISKERCKGDNLQGVQGEQSETGNPQGRPKGPSKELPVTNSKSSTPKRKLDSFD